MRRPTLQDAADHARFSKATASRVLKRSSQVDSDTRQRVLDAMVEFDYTPGNAAKRLTFGRTLTLDVAIWRLTAPQAAERLRGVGVVLGDTDSDLLATDHLLDLGHRRIAFLGDRIDHPLAPSSPHRHSGYARALEARGIEVRSELLAFGEHGRYEARALAAALLATSTSPTTVFAASDTQALGVISAGSRGRGPRHHGATEGGLILS